MSPRIDQARSLRSVERAEAKVIPFRRRSGDAVGRTIAITSGKGGVGKTQIAANLGVALARRGQRVLLLDADLGLASLDLALGIRPERDLRSVITGEYSLEEILVEGPAGVRLAPACPGRYDMANLGPAERRRLLDAVESMTAHFDALIIDTGAGIGSNAVGFAAQADDVVLVTTPDPTALRDGYAMAKVLNRRSGIDRIKLVANQVSGEAEGAMLHERIDSIIRRFLTLELEYLGAVPTDEQVRVAVSNGEPFVLQSPQGAAGRAMDVLVRRLCPQLTPREVC